MAPAILPDDAKPTVKPPQHGDSQLAVIRCGERRGGHRARIPRSHWPPRGMPRPNEPMGPHVAAECLDCGATVHVYHPPGPKVTVILYGPPAETQGQVLEEPPGDVVNEEDLPPGGTVVEEIELPTRGRTKR